MRSKKTLQAEKVAALTDMTVHEAKVDLENVKAEFGIGFDGYMKNRFYELDEDERLEIADAVEMVQEQTRLEREEKASEAATMVAEGAGVSVEEAQALITEARKRLGIGPLTYARHRFYELSEGEQRDAYDEIIARKKANEENLKRRARQVSLASNMTVEEAEADLKRVRRELGIKYGDYLRHRFYELDPDEQAKMADILNR